VTLMCVVETETDFFRYTDMTCVRNGIEALLPIPIPAVSADTEYPMPISVSP